jgi:hypothetical protein
MHLVAGFVLEWAQLLRSQVLPGQLDQGKAE